jgi:hypothetical protein
MPKKAIFRSLIFLMFTLLLANPVFASAEDDLFSSEDSLFADGSDTDLFGGDSLFEEASETDLSLSDLLLTNTDGFKIGGSYSFTATPTWKRNLDTEVDTYSLSTAMNTTLYFDARPDTDIRVYGKVDIDYSQLMGVDDLSITLMELFSDFNINDQVFFRVGKQTITWGVGYFFSPADLLNLESINPLDADADLEGPVAIKANMPLGVDNLYGYVVLPEDGVDVTDLGWAGKYEKVIGQTEVGFGFYYQDGEDPAAMVTVSSGINDISLFGEAVTKYGDSELYFQGTVGAQFSWTDDESDFGISFSGQYYYNGESSAISSNMAHYGATYLSVTHTDTLSTGLLWYGNMGDLSGILRPSFTWSPTDYISLSFYLSYLYGGTGDQFSSYGQYLSASVGFTLGGTDF